MRTLIAFALVIALTLTSRAIADGIFNPTATTGTTTVGGGEGINNLSIGGSGGGGGCTQGALKFNTNCNTVYAGH